MSYNPAPPPYYQPAPPKKRKTGKIIGLGCAGVAAAVLFAGCLSAVASLGSDPGSTGDAKAPVPSGQVTTSTPQEKPWEKAQDKPKKKTVVFKVWGTAPPGMLGSLDITYGSDSDSRDGSFKNNTFTAELPLDEDAMYYTVTAQLQGSGDINCSVTVDGHTEKAHASGGYNICHAQLSSGLFGGWN